MVNNDEKCDEELIHLPIYLALLSFIFFSLYEKTSIYQKVIMYKIQPCGKQNKRKLHAYSFVAIQQHCTQTSESLSKDGNSVGIYFVFL